VQCLQCQHDNPAEQKFCGECGARLQAICSACQTTNPPGQKFCGECGERLTALSPPSKPAAPAPTPESYTPQHLAERILTSRAALEGERKQVTVLFADLKGSMELLADRDPEEARAILDPVLERMMEAVHRYEGTVNQVMGDGIMALFGAPLAHEDHAVRACYAALRMQEAVKQYAEEVRRSEGLFIHIRVGLNSGEVVVRSIGSDLHMDYTAVGQTTHLAARMEQLAAPGSILIAPAALYLAEGYVQVTSLGPMQVKGVSAPIEVCEVVGAGVTRSRFQAATARGLTRFVGRDAEIETLRRTLERAATGQGQVVALVGEPGVGKSRLVWEFTHSHRTQGWLVLESRSVSYGKATSYLPVIDLLKTYCGVEARDDQRRMREKVLGKLLNLDRALEPALPVFLALLDVPTDDPAWEALDPPQRRQRTLDALKRLLLCESLVQPLVLVCEDLHWIDAETQALLDSLVESLPTARLLLLVNYRPEYEHHWGSKTYYSQVRLDPLPPESADELLQTLVGDDLSLAPLKRLLIERTEGNPFFLEESVRTLIETRVLVGERRAYCLAKPFESTQVPATVQSVLAARIDRLAPEDKRLLQAAAVIGKDLPYSLLRAIAELAENALQQSLAKLQGAEFLYEAALFPEQEYTFKHALTHEVAYGSLLQERRRALHARIVTAMEGLYAERVAEQVERLAHHALRSGVWEKAVGYLRQAGEKAVVRSAYQEAVGHFEGALAALSYLPESLDTHQQTVDLRLALADALRAMADFTGDTHLREAKVLAEAQHDVPRLTQVSIRLAASSWLRAEHARSVEYAQQALALAVGIGNVALQAEARFFLGTACYGLGDYRAAADCFRHNVRALTGEWLQYRPYPGAGAFAIVSRTWLVECLAELGEFADGATPAQEAVTMAEAINHPWDIALANTAVGYLSLGRGDFSKALPPLQRALNVCEFPSIPQLLPQIASRLAQAYAALGRIDEAVHLLEVAIERAEAKELLTGQARRVAWVSGAYLVAGRTYDAIACARRALSLAREHEERGDAAWVLRLHGEIASQAEPTDVEQAERYYRQAIALATELGMRPLVAHCHLGLGTLYRKVGRDEQARVELATAAEMYRAMEMTFWLEKAEAARVR
jgi:class 3 adenylate cyclase/tetratricopeptide (TPR) repeat protein